MSVVSEAKVKTDKASQYMVQLCKHFGHRVPATYTENTGRIELDMGVCTMQSDPDHMALRSEATDEASLARLEDVIAKHLDHFAWREKPPVNWVRSAG
ncbi:MAG: DUF2218 domain-containing protein [Alphaproteobacteria bacterium]|nr:DUF2218 domain-containing protein [Alphaproteobacteria bacterium]